MPLPPPNYMQGQGAKKRPKIPGQANPVPMVQAPVAAAPQAAAIPGTTMPVAQAASAVGGMPQQPLMNNPAINTLLQNTPMGARMGVPGVRNLKMGDDKGKAYHPSAGAEAPDELDLFYKDLMSQHEAQKSGLLAQQQANMSAYGRRSAELAAQSGLGAMGGGAASFGMQGALAANQANVGLESAYNQRGQELQLGYLDRRLAENARDEALQAMTPDEKEEGSEDFKNRVASGKAVASGDAADWLSSINSKYGDIQDELYAYVGGSEGEVTRDDLMRYAKKQAAAQGPDSDWAKFFQEAYSSTRGAQEGRAMAEMKQRYGL